jgi:anaerobic dimethyl sulfoxide reductase subunit B (iron-sulfur subunit)
MPQYGFFFNQARCNDCRACVIACKTWNNTTGPVKWLKMYEWEKGTFPNMRLHVLFAPCYHCENPVCVDAANGAMYKEDKYGAVLIDPDKAKSIDLRKAQDVCPYGAILFDSDASNATASKCTMCIDRLGQGKLPQCVDACHLRALDFGPLEDLQKKYGTVRQLEDMPSPDTTQPAIIFKAHNARKQLIPYDVNKAIALFGKRDAVAPLSPLYTNPSDATDITPGLVARTTLNMKPHTVAEHLKLTQHEDQ